MEYVCNKLPLLKISRLDKALGEVKNIINILGANLDAFALSGEVLEKRQQQL